MYRFFLYFCRHYGTSLLLYEVSEYLILKTYCRYDEKSHLILLSCCLTAPLCAEAAPVDTLRVESAASVGPYMLKMPYMIDSLDTQRKSMELKNLLQNNAPLMASRLQQASGKLSEGTALQENALYGFQFTVRTTVSLKLI